VRLFLAINLDPVLRGGIHRAMEPLREAAPSLSWIREPLLHFTMKFLGEQDESLVPSLRDAMRAVAATHREIELDLGGIGAFPNLRRPRVVWMGVAAEPRLELLHHDVEVACEQLGLPVEGRPFRPHLTLARVRERPSVDELRALSRAAKQMDQHETMVVESIDLMLSELAQTPGTGTRYTRLAAAPLRRD
jgi:RNA 2',3'-cyclic 3'-phosphodiesterase